MTLKYEEEYIYKNLRDESPPNGSSVHGSNFPFIGTNKERKDSTKSSNGIRIGGSGKKSNRSFETSVVAPATTTIPATSKSLSISIKPSRRKNSIGSSCLSAFSSSPGSSFYMNGTTPPGKTQSLPPNTSIRDYDEIIMSALRIPPEELANQLTLLDFPVFASIQPDELTSCAWTKKDKNTVTPNIVAFTKRFNHTSFWTVQEILSGDTPKQRAEILAHFIKVSKKLFELNNLHSLFAIISAMQSASVYRLKKTWSCLSKKDKQAFERLAEVFSDQNNWQYLREYLESLRLPCIPYLGLFLTDLIYIDLAHPHHGGLESEQRRNKMNNILRVISNYQQSNYSHIPPIEKIKKYLQSIRYIEELQNIFEEDQYKKSCSLEPPSSVPSSSSCSSKESFNVDNIPAIASLNLSPAKGCSDRIASISSGTSKFIPTHRKCRSLGSKFRSTSLPRNFYQKCPCPLMMIAPGIATISNKRCKCRIFGKSHQNSSLVGGAIPEVILSNNHHHHQQQHQVYQPQSRNLIDDSVLEDNSLVSYNGSVNNSVTQMMNAFDTVSTESAEGVLTSYYYDEEVDNCDISNGSTFSSTNGLSFQGCVRRKTLLKDGRKPAVASWQRYWLQLWANSLVYFPPKSFKGSERGDFKREPCKVCPLEGWTAQSINNPKHKNTFELINPSIGAVYKFRTDCQRMTSMWIQAIRKATQENMEKPLPINLMSFE